MLKILRGDIQICLSVKNFVWGILILNYIAEFFVGWITIVSVPKILRVHPVYTQFF